MTGKRAMAMTKNETVGLLVLMVALALPGAMGLQGCASSASEGGASVDAGTDAGDGGGAGSGQSMSFSDEDLFYYSQGERVALPVPSDTIAIRVDREQRDRLAQWLQSEAPVELPLDWDDLENGVVLVELQQPGGTTGLLEIVDRVNGSGLVRYASPVFVSPSARSFLTDEIAVKFDPAVSEVEIEGIVSDRKLEMRKANFPMAGWYLLAFTSPSGPNPLVVSADLYELEAVEYAHPNFMELIEPPDVGLDIDGQTESSGFVSEQNAMILYPNLFMEMDPLNSVHPMTGNGWEAIAQEDFEHADVLEGWSNRDDDEDGGQYFWGQVSDEQYPNLMGEAYQPDGNKGWVAGRHAEGDPDRWPDDDANDEGYATDMDTWLVYGPMDLSDALWARFWFRGVFWAPSTETFGWYASIDGENWYGHEETGIGEEGKLFYWWPRNSFDPPNMRMSLDLTRVPVLGDLTGQDGVYVGFRFQSDGTVTPRGDADNFSFYGAFIDDVLIEQCPARGIDGITDDPLSLRQWALQNVGQSGGEQGMDIDVQSAWELLGYVPGITLPDDEDSDLIVAVLDEGVDLDHEDLRLVPGYDATYDPENDAEHPDSHGGAFARDGHGTACAGIIGARRNGLGVVGIAPGVKIMPVRIAYSPEDKNTWVTTKVQQADAITWAVQNGARVLSNSWGGGFSSDLVEDAIGQAVDAGSLVVFASGNGNWDFPGYPSSLEDAVAVGAISPCGERKSPDSCDGEWWWGSNYGNEDGSEGAQIDVMAPGVLVTTTDITGDGGYVPANPQTGNSGNYYVSFNGTSAACPHVAAVAALMLAANPDLSPQQIRDGLRSTARDIGEEGWDHETGYGLVNARAAVSAAAGAQFDLRITDSALPDYLHIGEPFALDVTLFNDSDYPTGPFEVAVVLSWDEEVEATDALLWSDDVQLDAGAEQRLTPEIDVPADTEAGSYHLIIVVDRYDEVAEQDEDNNALDHPVQVAPAPHIIVKPSAIDFGMVVPGSGGQSTLQIKNESEQATAPLVVESITLEGDAAFDNQDTMIPSTPFELETNEYKQFPIYFYPEENGVYTGTLTIVSNDPERPEVVVDIAGHSIAPAPVLQLNSVPVDFGDSSTYEFFRIQNSGDGTLEWSLDTTGQPGWITQIEPTSGSTAAGATTNVTLNASRNLMLVGDYGWDLAVTSNGGDDTVAVAITVPGQAFQVTPEQIDFSDSETDISIGLQNGGNFTVNWTLVDDLPGWLDAGAMSGSLAAGNSANLVLSVDRAGLSTGDYNHTVQFGSNGGSDTVEVSMTVPHIDVPQVSVTADPEEGAAPLNVQFEASVTGGDAPFEFAWDFGDGDSSTDQSPTHLFESPGTYTAAVTVTDADADTDSAQVLIRVMGDSWSRTYGHGETYAEYHTYGLDAATDGGLLFSAESIYNGAGSYDFWVVKLDPSGDVDWETGIGGSGGDHPSAVRQTSDGGAIAVGDSYTYRTGTSYCDAWIVKLTSSGTVDWQRSYGGTGTDRAFDVEEIDGDAGTDGYVVVGTTTSFGAGGYDIWVMKLETSGAIAWEKSFGGSENDFGRAVKPTSDGGYIVAGDTQSFGAGASDVWVLKLSSSGAVQWETVFGGGNGDSPGAVLPTGDGGYVVGANTQSFGAGNSDYWLVKLDGSGGIDWQYTYGDEDDDVFGDAIETADGGYLLAGRSDSFAEVFSATVYDDAWLVKVDASGDIEWQKDYNKPYNYDEQIVNGPDWAYAVVQTTDGGYAVSGDSDWFDSDRNSDAWIFKIDQNGDLECDLDFDTGVVENGSATVSVADSYLYTAADTAANTAATGATAYQSGPEVFDHCGP